MLTLTLNYFKTPADAVTHILQKSYWTYLSFFLSIFLLIVLSIPYTAVLLYFCLKNIIAPCRIFNVSSALMWYARIEFCSLVISKLLMNHKKKQLDCLWGSLLPCKCVLLMLLSTKQRPFFAGGMVCFVIWGLLCPHKESYSIQIIKHLRFWFCLQYSCNDILSLTWQCLENKPSSYGPLWV